MVDIIRLLPDSVANQIAAGEVVQRPSSALKELIENSLDAGATKIDVFLKDAGKTSIRVIDNGNGMSEQDAQMAFTRHATSKIHDTNDLFAITSFGFRGEALASIAAVSEVVLLTRRTEDELGYELCVSGTNIEDSKPVMCSPGSDFTIKNLFFNVPARRRFLKSDSTELNHCVQEFRRIAMSRPDIHFSLHHNKTEVYQLPSVPLRQRISQLFGKQVNTNLIPVESSTSIVRITGFVTKPSCARKAFSDQYFFANGRYIRHPFLHRSVVQAYSGLIAQEAIPVYYLFLEVNPTSIDINIHPSKTEVKFEEEQSIFHILKAAIREALGKFNVIPSIDFDQEDAPELPISGKHVHIHLPEMEIDPTYNPFHSDTASYNRSKTPFFSLPTDASELSKSSPESNPWDTAFEVAQTVPVPLSLAGFLSPENDSSLNEGENAQASIMQFKGRFIVVPVKSGLMFIDQKRAHERILYEHFLGQNIEKSGFSQKILFPREVEFSPEYMELFDRLENDFRAFGFDFARELPEHILITGVPSQLQNVESERLLREMMDAYRNGEDDPSASFKEQMALTLARTAAVAYGKQLTMAEMHYLTGRLLACSIPHFAPDGQKAIHLIETQKIISFFER